MPNIEGNVSSANLNGNISTSSNISGNIYILEENKEKVAQYK